MLYISSNAFCKGIFGNHRVENTFPFSLCLWICLTTPFISLFSRGIFTAITFNTSLQILFQIAPSSYFLYVFENPSFTQVSQQLQSRSWRSNKRNSSSPRWRPETNHSNVSHMFMIISAPNILSSGQLVFIKKKVIVSILFSQGQKDTSAGKRHLPLSLVT